MHVYNCICPARKRARARPPTARTTRPYPPPIHMRGARAGPAAVDTRARYAFACFVISWYRMSFVYLRRWISSVHGLLITVARQCDVFSRRLLM